MKTRFSCFTPLALLCLILLGCSAGDSRLRETPFGKSSETSDRELEKQVIVFKNVTLVPMAGDKIIKNQSVLIKGSRISEIGPQLESTLPENTQVIDGDGAFLMPGLSDMHIHLRDDWLTSAWPVSPLNLYLANGVTTIRCLGPIGRSPDYALTWREGIKRGQLEGPTIYTCGKQLRGPVADPKKSVLEQKKQGFDLIKIYSFVSKEEFRTAVDTARKADMYTTGHIPFQVGLDGVLSGQMNEIAHIEELLWEFIDFDRDQNLSWVDWMNYMIREAYQQFKPDFNLDDDAFDRRYGPEISALIKSLKTANIPICTTMALDDRIYQKLYAPEAFLERPENMYQAQGYLETFLQGKEKHQVQFRRMERLAPFKKMADLKLLTALHEAGVPLLLGTDAGTGKMGMIPGVSIHDELRILTENGFTPYEAIATGTINAARVAHKMTGRNDFGTIEPGKRADLILLEKNPLADVAHIKSPRGVMAAGRWYDTTALQKMIIPRIPLKAAIHNVHEPNNTHKTYIDIVIGRNFMGKLPDDIDSIKISGPGGDLEISQQDFIFLPQFRDFWIRIPGSPEVGTYSFTVTSGDRKGSVSDIQTGILSIPTPDAARSVPAEKAMLRTTTPTFSWEEVDMPETMCYQLEINKLRRGRVYSTGPVKGMLSHKVPYGVLTPGQSYVWRIRVADSDNWVSVQNRSHSVWKSFTLAQEE